MKANRFRLVFALLTSALPLAITGCQTMASGSSPSNPGQKTLISMSVTPQQATLAPGTTQQFAATATYSDSTSANVSDTANWTVSTPTLATITSQGIATGIASGSTTVTASLDGISGSATASVATSVTTWHFDADRTGLNPGEGSLSPTNVNPATFGKLFSYFVDGYVYGQPLIVSNVTIDGISHNVLFAATEKDTVYAFDADTYSNGSPLWQTSLLQAGESPVTNGPIQPFEGVTSTPVVDLSSSTIYVVSVQSNVNGSTFRLNALDLSSGAQKFGGPITIQASVPGTNSDSVNGVVPLTTSCLQRAALLLTDGSVFIGFGSCHSGWLLAYDAKSLVQTGVFNASPNLNGEGKYASAGGVWMGGGGPAADESGNVYITTGNGPWDGATAFGDSVLKFSSQLDLLDYFTPDDYGYTNCADADLAAGGVMLVPGTSQAIAGGKTGKLYLVNTANLGKETSNDAGAEQALWFESDLVAPYLASCTDSNGSVWTTDINSYEIFGTSSYYNGSVYLGVTPTTTTAPAGVRQFFLSSSLTPGPYTTPNILQGSLGTTPFISSNGTSNGIVWMLDHGEPLQGGSTQTTATLRAYDAGDLTNALYNSAANPADTPGYGIKFSSPIVANGKVYISTGHDAVTVANPQGELDVFGLR
jgi:hypothetical protein